MSKQRKVANFLFLFLLQIICHTLTQDSLPYLLASRLLAFLVALGSQ